MTDKMNKINSQQSHALNGDCVSQVAAHKCWIKHIENDLIMERDH